MPLKIWLRKLLRRWGANLTAMVGGELQPLSGVFQPLTSVGNQSVLRQWMDLGEIPTGQYLYVGASPVAEADYVAINGKQYLPLRCEPIYFKDDVLCYWALCAPLGEDDVWNA